VPLLPAQQLLYPGWVVRGPVIRAAGFFSHRSSTGVRGGRGGYFLLFFWLFVRLLVWVRGFWVGCGWCARGSVDDVPPTLNCPPFFVRHTHF